MRSKMIYATVGIIAAALLIIGLFLLFHDSISEHIEREKIEPFTPQLNEIENTDTAIPPKTKEKLSEQAVKLNQEFDNTTAWIYIPDSGINFPVMYSGDNEYYLHRSIDGSYLRAGSIFLDGHCDERFRDDVNIIYGHNMSDGSMFAELLNYTDSDYFDDHRVGFLNTERGVYRIDFFAVSEAEDDDELYQLKMPVKQWLEHLKSVSYIWNETKQTEGGRYLSLSTCTYHNGSSRTIVTGIMTPIV